MAATEPKIINYLHFIVVPLKIGGCWDWFPKPKNVYQIIMNNAYLCLVLFVLTNLPVSLVVNFYTEGENIMESLDKIADGLPMLVSVAVVTYFALNKAHLYELVDYMNTNFKYHSARGLTNLTMRKSYKAARSFAYVYTACTLFTVIMYVTVPVIVHVWTKQPIEVWIYQDVTRRSFFVITFLQQALGQAFLCLAVGQLGVFFATNAILMCGQLDLLCCSLRNARYTALLNRGVQYTALTDNDIPQDEMFNYVYSESVMEDSLYHYDDKVVTRTFTTTSFDIYDPAFDAATSDAIRECARVSQAINIYRENFERFVSPLLVLRVVQVTLYLCTLLYAATLKFDMVTVEYLGAVTLDIFIYCYYGNQIIIQADRVTTAAYSSAWPSIGKVPRRAILNTLLSHRRPAVVKAWKFLTMDLHTFVVIIKTSFSYYTLLVNVNKKK